MARRDVPGPQSDDAVVFGPDRGPGFRAGSATWVPDAREVRNLGLRRQRTRIQALSRSWPASRRSLSSGGSRCACSTAAQPSSRWRSSSILEPFVYYSSETKQYSFDVLVALVIFLLFDHVLSSDRLRWWVALFVAGAVAPFFSHPSIFVLAGTGIALLLAAAAARDVRKLIFVSMAGLAWLVSFLVVYVTSTRNLNPHLSTGLRGENVDPVRVLKNTYVLFNDPGAAPRPDRPDPRSRRARGADPSCVTAGHVSQP